MCVNFFAATKAWMDAMVREGDDAQVHVDTEGALGIMRVARVHAGALPASFKTCLAESMIVDEGRTPADTGRSAEAMLKDAVQTLTESEQLAQANDLDLKELGVHLVEALSAETGKRCLPILDGGSAGPILKETQESQDAHVVRAPCARCRSRSRPASPKRWSRTRAPSTRG